MDRSEEISNVLIDYCKEYLSSKINFISRIKLKKLGKRTYQIYGLADFRIDLITHLYDTLVKFIEKERIPVFVRMSDSRKSLRFSIDEGKPFWYRVGLVLSDGAVFDRYRLIFSSSSRYTIKAILKSFRHLVVYPAYYMVSNDGSKAVCSYNFLIKDPEVAKIVSRIKSDKSYVSEITKYLLNNDEHLCQFLAGIIDGDGTIDKDNIRISISSADPIYTILNKVFENKVSYDSRKYLLRLSTAELRKRNLISSIINHLLIPHKRNRLIKIMEKRTRINIKIPHLSESDFNAVIESLDENDYALLSKFKYRSHGKYTYAYISASSKNLSSLHKKVIGTFSKISKKIGVDISKAAKIGTREIIVYHQDIVNLIRTIQELIKR